MPKRVRVAAIQLNAGSQIGGNVRKAESLILKAHARGARLITLPEHFLYRGEKRRLIEASITLRDCALLSPFQALAARLRVGLLLGAVAERIPGSVGFYATSLAIGPSGQILAAYRKTHLFDVTLPTGTRICESRTFRPGRHLSMVDWFGMRWGMTICYDVRFPELYRRLTFEGCRAVLIPSNFTAPTGAAHWSVLVRARAIENQVFVVAPAQCGKDPATGVKAFGHSMIIDPWGKVLAQGSFAREEILVADLRFDEQEGLRSRFPVLKHCKQIG